MYVCVIRFPQIISLAISLSRKHDHSGTLLRVLPTGGLLVGIGCLSPALASSLRNAIVAHVLRNVEHGVIGYYTVFLSQGPAIF